MDKFEPTLEQREQMRIAKEAGSSRVVLHASPEQKEYQRRALSEEVAAYEENLQQGREGLWRHMNARLTTLEAALTALREGHAENARQLMESKK